MIGSSEIRIVLEQTMTIRVPSAEFDGLLEDVSEGVSHFDKREIRAH